MRQITVPLAPKVSRREKDRLFQFLLLANFLEYLEAGAVPALLLHLARSFYMSSAELGLLGGVVYLSLSIGGPFAGYLLRHHDHRTILAFAVTINNVFTLLWALTPVDLPYSASLFIALRFLMGLTQCVLCVFLPLWTNQFAPRNKKASWMGYLQVRNTYHTSIARESFVSLTSTPPIAY
jgi:MFS family permease